MSISGAIVKNVSIEQVPVSINKTLDCGQVPFKMERNPWNGATRSLCGLEPLVSAELDRFGSRFPPIGAAKGRVRAKSFVRGSGTGMMG